MTTPLTTAEIVERLREQRTITLTDINAVRAYLDETSVLHHEAAAALLALEGEREAAEAELAKVREERDAFFDKLRQLLCINSVLTALKADAPLWLEHAEKLIDDHNAALAEKTV